MGKKEIKSEFFETLKLNNNLELFLLNIYKSRDNKVSRLS